MKRGISLITACVIMAVTVMTLFSGCSSENKYMSTGEWLYLINSKFGFSQADEVIHQTSIKSENEYFSDVQIAYGYGVLPEDMTDINTDTAITNDLCALTLAGAIYEENTDEITISDIDKSDYPDEIRTVINEGIMQLDANNRFNPGKKVDYKDAVEYLDRAYTAWVTHQYDSLIDFELNDTVVDLGGLSTYYSYEDTVEVQDFTEADDSGEPVTHTETKTEYAIDDSYVAEQRKWLADNNFSYNENSGVVTLDNISDKNISEESILTIPDSLEYPTGLYLKVTSINQNTSGSYELNVQPAQLEEVFKDDVNIEFSKQIDFSKCVIYDADGNIISKGKYETNVDSVSPMSYNNMATELSMSKELTIPLPGGYKGKLAAKDGSITLSVSNESTHSGGSHSGIKETDKATFSVEFSNMVVNACEFENFKVFGKDTGVINPNGYHKFSLNYDTKVKGSLSHKWSPDSSRNKNSLGLMLNSGFKEMFTKTTLNNQKIAAIPVYFLPGVAVEIDLYMRVSLEGEVSFTFGFSDGTISLESRKMKVTTVATLGDLSSKSVSGSIKAELAPQLNVCLAIANVDVIDVEGEVGVGLKIEAKLTEVYDDHTKADEPVPLEVDGAAACINILKGDPAAAASQIADSAADVIIDKADSAADIAKSAVTVDEESQVLFCLDITVYKILDFTFCSDKSLVGKALGLLKIDKLQVKIWDEESGELMNLHMEGGTDVPFSMVGDCTLSDRIDGLIEHGDNLSINPNSDVIVEVGETAIIDIDMLPKNKHKYYLVSDLEVKVDDDTVAHGSIAPEKEEEPTVKVPFWEAFKKLTKMSKEEDTISKLKITGLKEGKTAAVIRTADGMYKIPLNVTVVPKEVDMKEYMTVTIDTFSIGVNVNGTAKVNIVNVPVGKSIDDVFWSIDDTSIAKVDSLTGEITGIAEGNCVLKAFIPGYEEGAVQCLVSVLPDYNNTTGNGSVLNRQWIKVEGKPVMIIESA